MALTMASMSTSIKNEIIGKKGAPQNAQELQDFCDAIAKAIVENIQANAVLNGTVTSGTGSGGHVNGGIL